MQAPGRQQTGLTPLYARAPKGLRASGSAPRNRGKNTTLIADLTEDVNGRRDAANAVAFERYIEGSVPSLSSGQIVIMDNLAAHKSKKVDSSSRRGAAILWTHLSDSSSSHGQKSHQ